MKIIKKILYLPIHIINKIKRLLKRKAFKKEAYKWWFEDHLLKQYSNKNYLKYYKQGFSATAYKLFDLEHNDYKNYLSSFDTLKIRSINGRYTILLDDRRLFYKLIGDKIIHPEVQFTKLGKNFFDKNSNKITKENIEEYLKHNGGLFFNPLLGGGGKNAFSLEMLDNKLNVDNKETTLDYENLPDGTFTNLLRQSKYAKDIYPYSLNTIRVITINDNGNYSAPIAAHRFGTFLSGSKDNYSSGGVTCNINIETGIMSIAKSGLTGEFYEKHPDTSAPIKGVLVPHFKEILEKAVFLHKQMPYFKFIAWDFVILENDKLCTIEANAGSSTHIMQLDEGQRYKTIGEFLRKNNCIF